MKAIFLDIDGVLNSFMEPLDVAMPHHEWNPKTLNAFGIKLTIYPEMVARLNKITDATGAWIILSSSWRIGYLADWGDVVIALHNAGVKGFILGRTPHGAEFKTRGAEIEAWFDQNPNEKIETFVVLDDSGKKESLTDNWVQTDHTKGLQDEDVDKAIEILNSESSNV